MDFLTDKTAAESVCLGFWFVFFLISALNMECPLYGLLYDLNIFLFVLSLGILP